MTTTNDQFIPLPNNIAKAFTAAESNPEQECAARLMNCYLSHGLPMAHAAIGAGVTMLALRRVRAENVLALLAQALARPQSAIRPYLDGMIKAGLIGTRNGCLRLQPYGTRDWNIALRKLPGFGR